MKYFINAANLIIIGIVFIIMCLGFLTTYIGNSKKPKAKKKANPYSKNPYVYAHKKMLEDIKEYEDDIADLEPDEVEKYKKKHKSPKTSTDIEDWFKAGKY